MHKEWQREKERARERSLHFFKIIVHLSQHYSGFRFACFFSHPHNVRIISCNFNVHLINPPMMGLGNLMRLLFKPDSIYHDWCVDYMRACVLYLSVTPPPTNDKVKQGKRVLEHIWCKECYDELNIILTEHRRDNTTDMYFHTNTHTLESNTHLHNDMAPRKSSAASGLCIQISQKIFE